MRKTKASQAAMSRNVFGALVATALIVTVAAGDATGLELLTSARQECFTSSSGARCCPQNFDCADRRCTISIDCSRGRSTTCSTNVCIRPGEEPPAATPPPPAVVEEPVEVEPVQADTPQTPTENAGNENAPISSTPYSDLVRCNGPRVRREIRDLSAAEWQAFANAVIALKSRPSRVNPNVNQYEDLARIHSEFVTEAHGGSFFLPWHRLFVLLFENLLREVDPAVSVPYWNWAIDGENPAMSTVWGRAGGSVREADGSPACIPNGPFANLQTSHTTPHCVRRGFVSGQSESTNRFDNWLTVQGLFSRDIMYSDFVAALEATHGAPHVGIGGDMGVLGTAPNDPMFFIHHAFVDYIYRRWQDNGTGPPTRFGGTNPGSSGAVSLNSVIQAFQRRVRGAQNLNCVTYAEASGQFVLSSGDQSISTDVADLPEEFVEENNLDKERLARGHAILQESLDMVLNGTISR